MFGGYVPSLRDTVRSVTFRDGSSGIHRQQLARHHATANINAQFGSRWRARGIFNSGSQRQEGLLPPLDGSGNPSANFAIDDVTANYSTSLYVDVIPNTRSYFGLKAGYFYRNLYNEGIYQGDRFLFQTPSLNLPGVPLAYQRARLYTNVPSNNGRGRGKGPRLAAQFDGTLYATALGRHELKAGLQIDRIGLDALSGATGNMIFLYWDQSFMSTRGPLGYYQVISNDRLPNLGSITAGRSERHQPRRVSSGRLDGWEAADDSGRAPCRQRTRPFPFSGSADSGHGDPFHVPRQDRAPRRRVVGRIGGRQDEVVRLVGRVLRHHEAAAFVWIRWILVCGLLVHAGLGRHRQDR